MESNFTPTHIEQKLIRCEAMTRQEYHDFCKFALPEGKAGDTAGYLIQYAPLPTDPSNIKDCIGCCTWVPKTTFDETYKPLTNMSFGDAITMLKRGNKVARSGWNGKGMWLSYISAKAYDVGYEAVVHDHYDNSEAPERLPWIGMKTADNKFVPWLASQTDMLAEDWVLLD